MKRLLYVLPLFALLSGGCVTERVEQPVGPPPVEEWAEISFLAETPPSAEVVTRSETGSTAENKIDNIHVLVFDRSSGELVYKTKGKSLATGSGAVNDNLWTFRSTLPVGTAYTFMVLANAEDKLTGIEVGISPAKTKNDVLALTVNHSGKWNVASQPIPMWCEKELNLTASDTPVFEMVRMMCRVNVEVVLRDDAEGQPVDNFEMTSVRFYNYNTAGALVPDANNYDFISHTTLVPTIPASPGTQTGSALTYSGADIDEGKTCRGKIYVFEARYNGNNYAAPPGNSAWIDNPCLVIGGRYTTPQGMELEETFYRIDFIRKSPLPEVGDTWLSVLRNYSYNVTIVQVDGGGFPDPDVALRSAPINMQAQILEWDEGDMGEIAFDGTFFLSVSRDRFTVGSAAVDDELPENVLYVKTDYVYNNDPLHTDSGWYIDKIVDQTTGDDVWWLTLTPDHAAPDANNKVKCYFTYEENDTDAPRTAVVWIAAGRLRYPVYVTQRLSWIEIVDPDNGYVPLEELLFEVPAAGIPEQTQRFEVRWGPAGSPVGIAQTTPAGREPFPPSDITPNPSQNSWILNNGLGTQPYAVTSPAVSAELLRQDPLYERESWYTYTVGTGPDTETAAIRLHQIHYNIAVDLHGYKLDGGRHYLTVRSNTEWRIKKIEEWLYEQDPAVVGQPPAPVMLNLRPTDNLRVGTTGGPNLKGEAVNFTVVDNAQSAHRKKWGVVYVTFESPTGKFADLTVAIRFPMRGMTLLGLGYALDVRGFNPARPSPYHRTALYDLLVNEHNFGSLEDSRFTVEGFTLYGHNCQQNSTAPDGSAADQYTWRNTDLKKWLNNYNPDIIILSYSITLNQTESEMILEYLKHGGVVIMYYGGDLNEHEAIKPFFNVLFGRTFSGQYAVANANTQDIITRYDYPTTGSVFRLEDVDDPILNGPFRNIRGEVWGTHYRRVGLKESVVGDKVHILSRTDSEQNSTRPYTDPRYLLDQGYVNMFRHKEYNLFWIGNGMGTATYYSQINAAEYYHDPNLVTIDGQPALRTGFGATAALRFDVCNAYLFANAMAWAFSVTEHNPPSGGY